MLPEHLPTLDDALHLVVEVGERVRRTTTELVEREIAGYLLQTATVARRVRYQGVKGLDPVGYRDGMAS